MKIGDYSFSVTQIYTGYNCGLLPSQGFFIEFQTREQIILDFFNKGVPSPLRAPDDVNFKLRPGDILGKRSSKNVSIMLYQAGVPHNHHRALAGEIKTTARRMARGARETGRSRFQIRVKIVRNISLDEYVQDYFNRVILPRERALVRLKEMVYELKTCVDDLRLRLKKIEAVESGLLSDLACTICLEEFSIGLRAVRLPCSHVYHRKCIVQWLRRSNTCPLCRS